MCKGCFSLRELDMRGNPVTKIRKYREQIIVSTESLGTRALLFGPVAVSPIFTLCSLGADLLIFLVMLDGKEIKPSERPFLRILSLKEQIRTEHQQQHSEGSGLHPSKSDGHMFTHERKDQLQVTSHAHSHAHSRLPRKPPVPSVRSEFTRVG